jgi:hypothetical protein
MKIITQVIILSLMLSRAFADDNQVNIYEANGYRHIQSNGIANHKTGEFPNSNNPNTILPQDHRYKVTLKPSLSQNAIKFERQPFGVAINGIPFDPGTAEFYNNDPRSGFNEEAKGGNGRNLGLDNSNAHVQPTGSYHYHSIPWGLVRSLKSKDSQILVGWSADGFSIYVPNANKDALKSSYKLRVGSREGGTNAPSGIYDGTYTQDYEYVANHGDLDECNGKVFNGSYAYFLTTSFPFIPRCFKGDPDDSFSRAGAKFRGPEHNIEGRRNGHPPRPHHHRTPKPHRF